MSSTITTGAGVTADGQPITVRRHRDDAGALVRADVYVGGWRVTSVKTEAGLARRIARETSR